MIRVAAMCKQARILEKNYIKQGYSAFIQQICQVALENPNARPYIITCSGQYAAVFTGITPEIRANMSERKDPFEHNDSLDLAVEEVRPKIKQPPLYRVLLINDDYTPMEFVVDILESVFSMERTRATQVMLEVHTKGKGICGVFNFEIAETKVAQVTALAQQHQHPLLCTMEKS